MLKQALIPGTSLRISEIALGVMPWGTKVPFDRAVALYDAFRAAGGNVLDTAHIYAAWEPNGGGASERTLGAVLRQMGERRQLVITSKGGHPAESFYPRPDRYLAPEVLASDIKESLGRMGLETIDLFFVHRDDARVPVSEIIDALNGEVSAGRIRYFGASNWRIGRIEEANRYANDKGVMGFVASQPEFSLAHIDKAEPTGDPAMRWLTPQDLAWHERSGMPAFCYSPAAYGYFASNGTKGLKRYENITSRARLRRATELAHTLNIPISRLVIAFILAQKFPAIPILGTGDPDHLNDSLAAADVRLTDEQVQWLREG